MGFSTFSSTFTPIDMYNFSEYKSEFCLDWPLGDKENKVLDYNQAALVDILDTSDLLNRLFSQQVINMWQKEFIESKLTNHDKNEALLDIIRRLNRDAYYKLAKYLRYSNQEHIANILEFGGGKLPNFRRKKIYADTLYQRFEKRKCSF